jgi:hypothetical protein
VKSVRAAIIVIGVVVASARARAENSTWPRWELGYGVPFWGISVGHHWAFGAVASVGAHAHIAFGRLVLVTEGDASFLMSGDGFGNMERVGVGARFQWKRWDSPWHDVHSTADSFVEIGAGKQWIDLSGAHVERRDLAIGVGVEGGQWLKKRRDPESRRRTHLTMYARVRVLVAPAPGVPAVARCAGPGACGVAPSGSDLGIVLDLGGAWGR